MKNFLSVENFDFLLTFPNVLIFYDHDGSFEVFWWLKKLTKSQSLTFQCRWNFIRWSRNWLMKFVNFCDVLNPEIRSTCCIEDMKINLQAKKSFIEQKISDCLSSIKTLIGRSSIDQWEKLDIWRLKADDLIKIDQMRWEKLKP